MVRVLLVEDNPVDAQLTQDFLAEWATDRFDLTCVGTLGEGLARLACNRFDAILLDLSLPDAQGLDTVTQVLAASPGIPIVVLTGSDDHELALQAVQQGAQDYLVKGQALADLLPRAIRYAIERKRTEERLTYLAQYDHLTGLVNRTLFRDRLRLALARSKRTQQPLALMLLDLDRFKAVNDTRGHDAGDQLLKTVADRFRSCVRETDTVARMGGDEFAMMLEGVSSKQDIVRIAQRIIQAVREPFLIGGQALSVGVSIGITVCSQNDRTVDELLKQADAAMYLAKQQGGNAFQFHPPGEHCHFTVPAFQSWQPQA